MDNYDVLMSHSRKRKTTPEFMSSTLCSMSRRPSHLFKASKRPTTTKVILPSIQGIRRLMKMHCRNPGE